MEKTLEVAQLIPLQGPLAWALLPQIPLGVPEPSPGILSLQMGRGPWSLHFKETLGGGILSGHPASAPAWVGDLLQRPAQGTRGESLPFSEPPGPSGSGVNASCVLGFYSRLRETLPWNVPQPMTYTQ